MNIPMAFGLAAIVAFSGAVPSRSTGWSQGSIRNPQRLRAVQVLDQRASGAMPRVRFEWDPVRGATRYVLAGQWTTPTSWAVRSREYQVTRRSATGWRSERVWFEVSLPVGAHSWRVTALFGPNDIGDFQNPAQLSFELR
jgi:hypothetical protein